jgi:molybdenum cofactor guanylyltransferase
MGVTGIILAGGKNLRLGRNKALEKIGGIPLVERIAGTLRPLTDELIVVTAMGPAKLPVLPDVHIVRDVYSEKGPLGGIYSGLLAAANDIAVVVATDMPFLSASLLQRLIELSPGYDAVVPRLNNGMIESLHSVYRKTCLPVMKQQLDKENLRIRPVIDKLNVRYVEEAECRRYDAELTSFFNINRQADLDMAMKMEAMGLRVTSSQKFPHRTTGGK